MPAAAAARDFAIFLPAIAPNATRVASPMKKIGFLKIGVSSGSAAADATAEPAGAGSSADGAAEEVLVFGFAAGAGVGAGTASLDFGFAPLPGGFLASASLVCRRFASSFADQAEVASLSSFSAPSKSPS